MVLDTAACMHCIVLSPVPTLRTVKNVLEPFSQVVTLHTHDGTADHTIQQEMISRPDILILGMVLDTAACMHCIVLSPVPPPRPLPRVITELTRKLEENWFCEISVASLCKY
jgi:hypothetical protein